MLLALKDSSHEDNFDIQILDIRFTLDLKVLICKLYFEVQNFKIWNNWKS